LKIIWKTVKLYLEYYEGIICNSPKSCFRELFSTGLKDLYNKLPQYYKLMEETLKKIEKQVK
jgi:hypothetical protein